MLNILLGILRAKVTKEQGSIEILWTIIKYLIFTLDKQILIS